MMELLEVRKELKARKPEFIRQDTHKRRKLSLKWRKPKGLHSKIRHSFKGRRRKPSPGFKSPRKVKGLHSTGLRPVIVFSPDEVAKIRKETEGITLSKQVGTRKRLVILQKAKELGIAVLNVNADEHISKIKEFMEAKKKGKKEAKQPKKEHEKAQETKTQEKQETADEQKKDIEKEEKKKVLTKKV